MAAATVLLVCYAYFWRHLASWLTMITPVILLILGLITVSQWLTQPKNDFLRLIALLGSFFILQALRLCIQLQLTSRAVAYLVLTGLAPLLSVAALIMTCTAYYNLRRVRRSEQALSGRDE